MNEVRAKEIIEQAKQSRATKGYGNWRNVIDTHMSPQEYKDLLVIVRQEKVAADAVLVNIANGVVYV